MRALLQRVSEASVTWEGGHAEVSRGLLVLLGISKHDDELAVAWLAEKCARLRVFPDGEHRMNLSVTDIEGEVLVVSQFTLYGDCRRGRRPSFDEAMAPERAERLYEAFVGALRSAGLTVATGSFGAMMSVSLVNEGPVTLILDSP